QMMPVAGNRRRALTATTEAPAFSTASAIASETWASVLLFVVIGFVSLQGVHWPPACPGGRGATSPGWLVPGCPFGWGGELLVRRFQRPRQLPVVLFDPPHPRRPMRRVALPAVLPLFDPLPIRPAQQREVQVPPRQP